MSVYSKALHHVNNKDFKKTRQKNLDEQEVLYLKKVEEEISEQQKIKEIKELSLPYKSDWKSELFVEKEDQIIVKQVKEDIKVKVPEKLKSNWREELYPAEKEEEIPIIEEKIEVPEHLKSNWKKELAEAMTTSGAFQALLSPLDAALDTLDAADAASFTANNGGFDATIPQDGLMGAAIVSNGTGSGNNGGFNLGRGYLAFNGVGFDLSNIPGFDNTRAAILTPFDATRATTLEITAIVGNGSNGGEAPGVDQDIQLWYTDPNGDYPTSIIAAVDDDGNLITVVPHNGSGSLRTYSVTIPNNEYNQLRRSGVSFVLSQSQGTNPLTTGDNYGITEIKLKRTTPVNIFVPLSDPEAVSFFRVGPTSNSPVAETPEQRYRKVMQQLLASKNYTTSRFGSNYPGSNFSGIRGVSASPLGRDGMLSAWGGDIVPTGAWGDYLPPGSLGRDSGIVPTGAWGDYFPPGTFGRADIGPGMAQLQNPGMGQGSTVKPGAGVGPGMAQLQNPAMGQVSNANSVLQSKLAALEKENQRLSQSKNPADWDKAQFGTAPEISRLRAELSKLSSSASTSTFSTSKSTTSTTSNNAALQSKLAALEKENQRLSQSKNPADWNKAQFGTAPEIAKLRAELSKSSSSSTSSGKSGSTQQPKPSTQQPKPSTQQPKLDKFGRQVGTPLPPGVTQDMLKGGKTASPVGDAAIMAASALAARAGLNALKSGGAAPKPLTPTPAPKPSTPSQRVQNFNARMDAARNPNTGGYRDILKPQQGPIRSSGGKR